MIGNFPRIELVGGTEGFELLTCKTSFCTWQCLREFINSEIKPVNYLAIAYVLKYKTISNWFPE